MNAAIYARVSVERIGIAEDAKSPARQVTNARAFAAAKGWTVHDDHIYDDTASGAEFKRRPAFSRMMATLPHPPFQVLIVSEQKSIGREMSETGMVIKQLAQAGVEIVEYVHGKSLTPKNAMDKVVGTLQSFGDETHREQTAIRTYEAHVRLAKAARVTGGRVYGYRNRPVFVGEDASGNPLKSHVVREINPTEAAVVRRIFDLYDSGEGLKRIAKTLTAERAPFPKPFVRKDPTKVLPVRGWSPSSIRAILSRSLYAGVVTWNKSKKRDDWGQKHQTARPEADWLRTAAEHLRIVPEDLWKRVQTRRADTEGKAARFASGRLSGRPPKHATPNLLAGLATCASCGGGLIVETSPRKRGRIPEYVCFRHRVNGSCANALHIPVSDLNESILQEVEQHALTVEAIECVIRLSERDDVADRKAELERERADVERRIENLVEAIEVDGLGTLLGHLRKLEDRQRAIDAELRNLAPIPRLPAHVLESRLAEWRRLLRSSTTQARTVLQRILRGRLTFTPHTNPVSGEIDGYDFEGPTRFDRLFTGCAGPRPAGLIPGDTTGCENITEADTFDADYGVLLEKYSVKGVASPTGFEPVFWP